MTLHALEPREALALASLVVDLHVTQIVNGVRGVHAMVTDDALAGLMGEDHDLGLYGSARSLVS